MIVQQQMQQDDYVISFQGMVITVRHRLTLLTKQYKLKELSVPLVHNQMVLTL